jgi:hypothetical protein
VNNIKMDLGEIGYGGVDGVGLAQDTVRWGALVNAVMNFGDSITCWDTIEWLHNW